jgi:hypothetical protein
MPGNISPLSTEGGAPKFFPTNIPKSPGPKPKFNFSAPFTIPKL